MSDEERQLLLPKIGLVAPATQYSLRRYLLFLNIPVFLYFCAYFPNQIVTEQYLQHRIANKYKTEYAGKHRLRLHCSTMANHTHAAEIQNQIQVGDNLCNINNFNNISSLYRYMI